MGCCQTTEEPSKNQSVVLGLSQKQNNGNSARTVREIQQSVFKIQSGKPTENPANKPTQKMSLKNQAIPQYLQSDVKIVTTKKAKQCQHEKASQNQDKDKGEQKDEEKEKEKDKEKDKQKDKGKEKDKDKDKDKQVRLKQTSSDIFEDTQLSNIQMLQQHMLESDKHSAQEQQSVTLLRSTTRPLVSTGLSSKNRIRLTESTLSKI